MICPAYNSAFILGEDAQLDMVSQFTSVDSVYELKENLRSYMKKNEFGIVVEVKPKKKQKLLDFVPMEMVLPLIDSALLDSTGQMMEPGYNREMIVYNRKFGEILAFESQFWNDTTQVDSGKRKRKGKKDDEDEEDEELEDELDPDDPDYDPWSSGGGDDANW